MNPFTPALQACLEEMRLHPEPLPAALAPGSPGYGELEARFRRAAELDGAAETEREILAIAATLKDHGLLDRLAPSFRGILEALKTRWQRAGCCRLR